MANELMPMPLNQGKQGYSDVDLDELERLTEEQYKLNQKEYDELTESLKGLDEITNTLSDDKAMIKEVEKAVLEDIDKKLTADDVAEKENPEYDTPKKYLKKLFGEFLKNSMQNLAKKFQGEMSFKEFGKNFISDLESFLNKFWNYVKNNWTNLSLKFQFSAIVKTIKEEVLSELKKIYKTILNAIGAAIKLWEKIASYNQDPKNMEKDAYTRNKEKLKIIILGAISAVGGAILAGGIAELLKGSFPLLGEAIPFLGVSVAEILGFFIGSALSSIGGGLVLLGARELLAVKEKKEIKGEKRDITEKRLTLASENLTLATAGVNIATLKVEARKETFAQNVRERHQALGETMREVFSANSVLEEQRAQITENTNRSKTKANQGKNILKDIDSMLDNL